MLNKPLVSVICLTYNQESYISQCFDGFMSQKTNFLFEVLVYDDASQDGTADIIRKYQEQYPEIIKPTYFETNQFSQGKGFAGIFEGIEKAQGKYIAYCEGDDYWCDECKLQKQVDFLEAHLNYEVCAHETIIKNDANPQEDGILFTHTNVNLFLDRTNRNSFSFNDTLTGNIFHISSLMFRAFPIKWPEWICSVTALDMVFFMLLSEKGDIYMIREVMSVYRHNKQSITSTQKQFDNQIAFNNLSMQLVERMNSFWHYKYQNEINKVISRYYVSNMFCYLSKSYRNFAKAKEMAICAFRHHIQTSLQYIVIESWRKLKKQFV